MTKRDEKPKSDPVIQLTGRSYMASHFEEMLLGWSRKRGDKPSLLHEITLLVKEIIRRDQEHQGDLLRSAGSSEGHGKGEHADTVLNAVMAGLEGRWEEDGLHKNAVSMCEHLLAANVHMVEALAAARRASVYDQTKRESTLVTCANPRCERTMTNVGDDRPRDGRCERCYRFRRRTDRDWTPSNIEGENGEAA